MARWLMLRFHSPLIEPNGPFVVIRLSDKTSRFRPRERLQKVAEADLALHIMQVAASEGHISIRQRDIHQRRHDVGRHSQ